jgi:hypothetical protein
MSEESEKSVWSEVESTEGQRTSDFGEEMDGRQQRVTPDNVVTAEDVDIKSPKNKVPIYVAAGLFSLIGLGAAGFILMKLMDGMSEPTNEPIMEMARPLESPQSASLSMPGGSQSAPGAVAGPAPVGDTALAVTTSVVPAQAASAAAPVATTAVPATPVASVAAPVVSVVAAAPVSDKPVSEKSISSKPAVSTVANPTVKTAKVSSQDTANSSRVRGAERITPRSQAAPVKSAPAKVKTPQNQLANSQDAQKPASTSAAPTRDSVERFEDARFVERVIEPSRIPSETYRIIAISPSTGDYLMAHLKSSNEKNVIVHVGDVLPSGARVTGIDPGGWRIVTTAGVIR